MLYFAAIVSLSLIAKAFGNYAVTFLPVGFSPLWHHYFSIGIVLLFVLINLKGAKDVAIWEKITVGIKFAVLCVLAIAGIAYLDPVLLSPSTYPPAGDIFLVWPLRFLRMKDFESLPIPPKTCQTLLKPYPEPL